MVVKTVSHQCKANRKSVKYRIDVNLLLISIRGQRRQIRLQSA